MPSNVKVFLALSFVSLALGIGFTAVNFSAVTAIAAKVGGAKFVVILQLITIAILSTLFLLAGVGARNWARWTLLVLFVLGAFSAFPSLILGKEPYPFQHAELAIQTVLQLASLYFVFTGNARDWFAKTGPTT